MICNSLGSNYSFSYCLKALGSLIYSNPKNISKLKKYLEEKYNGQAYLFYKGRDAIEFSLKSLNIGKNDQVLTQAFSCFAIEEAILRSKAKPIYTDLEKNQLNPNIADLEKAYKKASNPKALLIQHTLGSVANISDIKSWCQKNKLYLIEDIAQGIGGKSENKDLGTFGDAVILSFGRDKIIDAVSGGACIIKVPHKPLVLKSKIPQLQIIKDMLYPINTYLIRNTYHFFLGRAIHYFSIKFKIITSPIKSPTNTFAKLPNQHANLALDKLKNINSQLKHRQKIYKYYQDNLPKSIQFKNPNYKNGSCLRFPIIINNIPKLNILLEKNNIHLSDRWYRKAVDCGNTDCKSSYGIGECSNAENLAKKIYNLPTHQYIKITNAKSIVQLIKLHIQSS